MLVYVDGWGVILSKKKKGKMKCKVEPSIQLSLPALSCHLGTRSSVAEVLEKYTGDDIEGVTAALQAAVEVANRKPHISPFEDRSDVVAGQTKAALYLQGLGSTVLAAVVDPDTFVQREVIQHIALDIGNIICDLEHGMLQCDDRDEAAQNLPSEDFNFLSFRRDSALLDGWCNSNRAVSNQQFMAETEQDRGFVEGVADIHSLFLDSHVSRFFANEEFDGQLQLKEEATDISQYMVIVHGANPPPPRCCTPGRLLTLMKSFCARTLARPSTPSSCLGLRPFSSSAARARKTMVPHGLLIAPWATPPKECDRKCPPLSRQSLTNMDMTLVYVLACFSIFALKIQIQIRQSENIFR